MNRLDRLDEKLGVRARPACPQCLEDFASMPVPDEVPLEVRVRLAWGFRVPREYVPWALREARMEGWPSRAVFMQFPMIAAMMLLIYGPIAVITPGPSGVSWMVAGVQLATMLIVGSWVAAFHPKWARDRWVARYLSAPRRGCPIHQR